MKHLRQISAVTVLTCVFALNTFAGIMDGPVAPPTQPVTATTSETEPTNETTTIDTTIEAVVNGLQFVLAII
jgi:hypothetical protein